MRSDQRALLLIVASMALTTAGGAQPGVASVPRDTLVAWLHALSNTGRWGADDQLGTLNLITPAKRMEAARLVRAGTVVSLARDLLAGPDSNAIAPARLGLFLPPANSFGVSAALDTFWVFAHGYSYTHLDGLSHFAFAGSMYNGVATSTLTPAGATRLGIENMSAGIVTRGVLVDIPRLRRVDYLDGGMAITAADLESWERQSGVRISSGDALLIRTGRDARSRAHGAFRLAQSAAGLHPSVVAWLKARGVAILGGDGGTDMAPSLVQDVANPVHLLAIVGLGMPLLDNLALEELADTVARTGRPTFLLVASPVRIKGSTSSLINPLAIF